MRYSKGFTSSIVSRVVEYLDQLFQYGTIKENTVDQIHDQNIKEEQDAEVIDSLML